MARKTTQTIKVQSNEENPEPLEVIADSIIKVADAFDKIASSKLKLRAVIVLIKDVHRDLAVGDIEKVLTCAPLLRKHFLK